MLLEVGIHKCILVHFDLFMDWSFPFPLALDDDGKLTNPLGMQMAEFPLNPMFARMLLLSGTHTEIYMYIHQL